ncbi:uncharacterized protein LOC113117931 [Carassius auratus]|uniref:Uncharacterized protein LOC113117931 n=1 Tax=Carassius auratus TaxID=7957 RepID=A0A6P6RB61_CARAU|nr:uncharacterized protein LOC113117931 [Carassius auratus]
MSNPQQHQGCGDSGSMSTGDECAQKHGKGQGKEKGKCQQGQQGQGHGHGHDHGHSHGGDHGKKGPACEQQKGKKC